MASNDNIGDPLHISMGFFALQACGRLGIWLAVFISLLSFLSCFKDSLIDDAFVTLSYASNLLNYGKWGFLPGRIGNTATSPLNVILTTWVGVFAPDLISAALWLAALELTGLLACLVWLARRITLRPEPAVIGFVLLIGNPLLLSTLGLESFLYLALMAGALCAFAARRWNILSIVLALLTLTRPDGILLFAILFWWVKSPASRHNLLSRQRLQFVALYATCLLPWYAFSWYVLGSLVPDTLFIKMFQSWGGFRFTNGLALYLRHSPGMVVLSIWPLLAVPVALLAWRNEAGALIRLLTWLTGAYAVGYSMLRVPPYHWYYAPLLGAAILMVTLSLAAWFERMPASHSWLRRTLLLAAVLISTCAMGAYFVREASLSPAEAPIHTNWATHQQYRQIGLWLRTHVEESHKIRVQCEVGTIGFYSQRQVISTFTTGISKRQWLDFLKGRSKLEHLIGRLNSWHSPVQEPERDFAYTLRCYPSPARHELYGKEKVVQRWTTASRWQPRGLLVALERGRTEE